MGTRRRTTTKRAALRRPARRRTKKRHDELSTALLLPDIHPWLKEYFAAQNLVPVQDEAWHALPEILPIPLPTTTIGSIIACRDEIRGDAPVSTSGPPHYNDPMPPRRTLAEVATYAVSHRQQTKPEDAWSLVATPQGAQPQPSHAAVPIDAPPTDPTSHSSINPQDHSLFTSGAARQSTAPIPFVVPVCTSIATPSHHYVRLVRRRSLPRNIPAPNFLEALHERFEPARNAARAAKPRIAQAVDRWKAVRADTQRSIIRIAPPYDDLLIVHLTLGPMTVLWNRLGRPCWMMIRPYMLNNERLNFSAYLRSGIRFVLQRVSPSHLERLWRLPTSHTRSITLPAGNPFGTRWTLQLQHAGAFAAVLLLILLPFKIFDARASIPEIRGRVLGATATALDTLRSGGTALSESAFDKAIVSFDEAQRQLETLPQDNGILARIGFTIGRLIPQSQTTIGRAEHARRAGVQLAQASAATARGLSLLASIVLDAPSAPAQLDAAGAAFASARTIAERARTHLSVAAPAYIEAIDGGIGELRRAEALVPILSALGGIDRPRRILLLFQNPAELRATGGFMGSIALVDVHDGTIESFELPGGGSYDVAGLSRIRVLPPDPLRLVQQTWQFQDANWFPDFPTSARKIRWFYEQSGGPTVDAVIAVNAPVLEDILAITGPVFVGDQAFSSSDVLTVLTDTIERSDARATGAPKAVLGDLAPELLRRLLALTREGSIHERLTLLDRFIRALEERDILLSFTDDAVQRHVVRARWAGAIQSTAYDYLAVVHSNIGGGKSDAVIRTDATHHATVLADGSIVDTVTLTRAHEGPTVAVGNAPSAAYKNLHNVDYVRFYVPRGAELLAADGFEEPPAEAFEPIPSDALPDRSLLAVELDEANDPALGIRTTQEFGKTVFGGWLQLDPGTTQRVRLVYRLPWRYTATAHGMFGRLVAADPQPYTMFMQQQPGTRMTVRHTIELAPSWTSPWHASNLTAADGTCTASRDSCDDVSTWTITQLLSSDLSTGIMIIPATK